MLAPLFNKINPSNEIIFTSPWCPANSVRVLRARGNARNRATYKDLIFTGPRLKVCYSGCRWNTVVFAVDESQTEFEDWLYKVFQTLEDSVKADPPTFKVNPRNHPTFSQFIVQPSSNPDLYAPELRTRLATRRPDPMSEPVNAAHLMDATTQIKVDPTNIKSGSFMRPVFKLGYYKEGDNFGLTLTVLKAECEPNPQEEMSYEDLEMDIES
jgi:hypothetical protein